MAASASQRSHPLIPERTLRLRNARSQESSTHFRENRPCKTLAARSPVMFQSSKMVVALLIHTGLFCCLKIDCLSIKFQRQILLFHHQDIHLENNLTNSIFSKRIYKFMLTMFVQNMLIYLCPLGQFVFPAEHRAGAHH